MSDIGVWDTLSRTLVLQQFSTSYSLHYVIQRVVTLGKHKKHNKNKLWFHSLLPLIVCSYRFSCLIKDSIVSSCSHSFSFPHFSITCHFFSCVSILRVLANSYQNVVSIISILHLFCRHKHNFYRVNKKRPHNCNILRKMRAPVVRGKRKTSQFLRKHCCFLDWSSLGGRHTFVTCKTIHVPFGPRKYMKN